jgi:hypothetical protein
VLRYRLDAITITDPTARLCTSTFGRKGMEFVLQQIRWDQHMTLPNEIREGFWIRSAEPVAQRRQNVQSLPP